MAIAVSALENLGLARYEAETVMAAISDFEFLGGLSIRFLIKDVQSHPEAEALIEVLRSNPKSQYDVVVTRFNADGRPLEVPDGYRDASFTFRRRE